MDANLSEGAKLYGHEILKLYDNLSEFDKGFFAGKSEERAEQRRKENKKEENEDEDGT